MKFFHVLSITMLCLLAIVLIQLTEIATQALHTDESQLEVVFLDIGQGDATFITFDDGKQMLVDCAKNNTVLEALGRRMPLTDRSIDYLVITHPDLDHYGGCIDVMRRFDIDEIWYTGAQKPESKMWRAFWQELQRFGGTVRDITSTSTIHISETQLSVLYPVHDLEHNLNIPSSTRKTGYNNGSIVLKLTHGKIDVLLTGDAEEELETYLVETYDDMLDVEVLKASHHGSGGSSISEFIDEVTPQVVVVSAGAGNRYGHPHKRALWQFDRAGAEVFRTDQQGDILISINTNSLWVDTQY